MKFDRFVGLATLGLFLAACGGNGGSDSSSKLIEDWADKVAEDPSTQTSTELKDAYWGYAQALYSGSTADADTNPQNVQAASRYLLSDSSLDVASLLNYIIYSALDPYFESTVSAPQLNHTKPLVELVVSALAKQKKVNNKELQKASSDSFPCYFSGSVSVDGNLDENGTGTVSIEFSSCMEFYGTADGSAVVRIDVMEQDDYSSTFYYNKVNLNIEDVEHWEVTGYSSENYSLLRDESDVGLLLTNLYSGEQYLENVERNVAFDSYGYASRSLITGDISIGSIGKLSIATYAQSGDEQTDAYTSFEFGGSGSSIATLEVGVDRVKFLLDSDGNGEAESGLLYEDLYDFYVSDLSNVQLAPISQLSFSPRVYGVWVSGSSNLSTLDSIVVDGDYYDPDTPHSELEAHYEWTLNGEVLTQFTSDTLPPGTAVYGDSLQVRLAVFDGYNTGYSQPLDIDLVDSPLEVTLSDVPEWVAAGELVSFSVVLYDADTRDTTQLQPLLAYGPEGTDITSDGAVEWTAAAQLFNSTKVHFGFMLEEGGEVTDVVVNVRSADAAIPIARSGIEVPYSDRSTHVGNFLVADGMEIITTDNKQRLFALKTDEDSGVYQAWMYPYSISESSGDSIVQVALANLDDDESSEILVATPDGVYVIWDEYSLATRILTMADGSDSIMGFAVADADNNGETEIALLSGGWSGARRLTVYSLLETATEVFDVTLSDTTKEIIFSNVDADPALELITNDGFVYDGATWQNQWFYGAGFGGDFVAAGDINGDGLEEIIGGSSWGDITVYSLATKQAIATLENFNTCSLLSDNVDNDSADELLVGDCQWGNISAYSEVNGNLISEWSINTQGHGAKGIAVGDIDSDDEMEVMWGTGQSSSGADHFVIVDVLPQPVIKGADSDLPQLDSFMTAGWANITPDEHKAVFIVPTTNSDYDGQRLVYMDENGRYTVSQQISDNWQGGRYGVITDFDKNGYDDIFLATAELYDGGFKAMDLETLSVAWEVNGGNNVGLVDAFDVNGDSYMDAVYLDGTTIRFVNIYDEVLLGSVTADSSVNDIALTKTGDGTTYLAIASSTELSFYGSDGTGFTFLSKTTTSNGCMRIGFYDATDSPTLVCSARSGSSFYAENTDIISYSIVDGSFSESSRFEVNGEITDFVLSQSTGTLLAGVAEETGESYYETYYMAEYSLANKAILWSSSPLLGRVQFRSIKYVSDANSKLMFSTQHAMYLLK